MDPFGQSLFTAWSHQPILLGITFGLLHAFDADHVAAIGGLAVGDRRTSPTSYALRWALGHAAALALFGVCVLGLGLWGVTALSSYAELLVCATLLAVGAHAVRDAGRGLRDSGPAGLLKSPRQSAPVRLGGRAGVLMGMLHGGAGSAAVIALVPVASYDTGLGGGLYLGFFSLGVLAGACGFSQMLARLFVCAERAGAKLRAVLHGAVGAAAIVTGALLLMEITRGG